VSQSSVREAFRRLEALSLVDSLRNRGTFVSSLTAEQVEEIYDVRLAVELLALRSNFARISPETLDDAERLLDGAESDREIAFLGEVNKRFHAAFYKNSGKLVKDILQNVYGNLTRLWVDFVKKRPSLAHHYDQSSRREHRELLNAARNGDLRRAEELLTAHVGKAREALLAHLSGRTGPERRRSRALPSDASEESPNGGRIRVSRKIDRAGSSLALRSPTDLPAPSGRKTRP
jgi:DNA-binding GntR family transcriptional regulator